MTIKPMTEPPEVHAALARLRTARTHPTHNVLTLRLTHADDQPPIITVSREPFGTIVTFASPHALEIETVHIRQQSRES